jgi:hypothetical protein
MTISVAAKLRPASTCVRSADFAVPACCARRMAGGHVYPITFFTSLEAVRGFAGDDYEQAVVEDAARPALSRWDERVSHHEVVTELE